MELESKLVCLVLAKFLLYDFLIKFTILQHVHSYLKVLAQSRNLQTLQHRPRLLPAPAVPIRTLCMVD